MAAASYSSLLENYKHGRSELEEGGILLYCSDNAFFLLKIVELTGLSHYSCQN